jgi:hypothetical protein
MRETQWRDWLRHIPMNHSTNGRRSSRRRGNRLAAIQPALLQCQAESLEARLMLSVTAPASASVNENAALTFSAAGGNAIEVADAAATATSDNVSLSVTHGRLKLANSSSLTFLNGTANDSAAVNVTGTLTALNAALNGLVYQPASGYSGSDSLAISVFDSGNDVKLSAKVMITVDAPPKIDTLAPSTVLENGSLSFSTAGNNPVRVTDTAEVDGNDDSLTLSVTHGTLTLGTTNNVTFTAGSNGTSSMTVAGTVANLNAALDGLAYAPTTGFAGPTDSLTISIKDPIDNQTTSRTATIFISVWTAMSAASLRSENNVGSLGADFELLLPNGDLMVHGGGGNSTTAPGNEVGATTTWYEITPDRTGSYANGTWTQLVSMNVARLYFSADVLPNGDVFVFGGEYASDGQITTSNGTQFSNSAEIFTPPSANNLLGTWTMVASDPHTYPITNGVGQTLHLALGGDQPSEVLPNGSVIVGNIFDNGTEIYTPSFRANAVPDAGTWKTGPTKVNSGTAAYPEESDEESWVKLGNGDILTYDINASNAAGVGQAEILDTSTMQWSAADGGDLPLLSSGATGNELGPALLLPNGNAFFAGTTGVIAYYHPGTTATNGNWTQGPTLPSFLTFSGRLPVETPLVMDDAPGAVMPNGDLLLALSPAVYLNSAGVPQYPAPTFIYEFDPGTHVFTNVTSPSGLLGANYNSFVDSMLVLPNGQILLSNDTSTLSFYTLAAGDGPRASWRPTITSFIQHVNGTYTLTGTQLNGLDEGAAYGDDKQVAENYPLVQLTNISTGTVYYATTSNWSSTGVATGNTPETVNVVLPATLPSGTYSVVVIANGIASQPIMQLIEHHGRRHFFVDGAPLNLSSNFQLSDVSGPVTLGTVDSSPPATVALISGVTLPPAITPGSNVDAGSSISLPGPATGSPALPDTVQFHASLRNAESVQWAGLNAALEILSA